MRIWASAEFAGRLWNDTVRKLIRGLYLCAPERHLAVSAHNIIVSAHRASGWDLSFD
jgi:hypothetical protein